MLFKRPLKYYAENLFLIDGYWHQKRKHRGSDIINKSIQIKYGLVKNYIIPFWGNIPPSHISIKNVNEQLYKLRVSGSLKNRILSCLSDIYTHLIEEDVLKENPIRNIVRFSNAVTNKRGALSLEELARLFRPNHDELIKIWHSQTYATAFLVLRDTSLRPGELRALQWGDWHPDTRFFPITKAIESETRDKIKGTKTGSIKPAIVSEFTAGEIEHLRSVTKKTVPEDFIFVSRFGYPPSDSTLSLHFRIGVRRVGLNRPEITPYWLRHTFNTLALLYLDEADVRKLMGHTSKMTRHYRHPDIFLLQKEAEKIAPKINKLHALINCQKDQLSR
ncbi:MAG: tyrosine-type recombinase/integrase [Candidatus Margulisbacteria bacterium]|jgi:integrase|nr:tyrosine-type recombinase/integrase [Candidatus Margulisiibacteriota bacterium]